MPITSGYTCPHVEEHKENITCGMSCVRDRERGEGCNSQCVPATHAVSIEGEDDDNIFLYDAEDGRKCQ